MTAAAEQLDRSVLEMARALHEGALSPVALTEAALERIASLGPRLNCFVTVTGELALAQAHAAERELRAGRRRSVFTGFRSASRTTSTRRGSARRGAPVPTSTASRKPTRRWWSGCGARAPCSSESCR